MKKLNGLEPERELAANILDIFEDFLDRYNITIPSEDREGKPEEARLFGSEYYELEDELTSFFKKIKCKWEH